ncbi:MULTISPECIES: glutamine amidotransferase [unclassified Gordonia (in: high G+C Gram-positive bacteria)]|uniref:glutamine amidotransferase n=1 Tax=unclassified Gordonia (in: high G+C Gram-positive bacteria) TaxID=2657482 RepID=UPI001F0FD992|nr:glutamine amidotransferase [Gordonia sp. ABSL49_1]MCH5641464.1 glutamine amidotransferase [Gordonia sp. ABSL49_1]
MSNLPFLLLSIRAETEAADDEYRSVIRLGGLAPADIAAVNLTQRSLGSIDLDDWSAIILGGGPYNVSDPQDTKTDTQRRVEGELLELVGRVVEADFPFLGCCYGVGAVGSAIGATIDRAYSEPVGAVTVSLTDEGRRDPLFADVPDTFDAYGGHKEAAATLPDVAVHLATSPTCPVQAFRVGHNVYATQFHPELDADSLSTRIDVYREFGYFAPEEADSLKAAARERDARHPAAILQRFVERYRRPSS